ncbi:hypothetical protein M2480_002538 [Parabacteroides sp. PFB2-12]|uniref:NVEALA domain-containing protein n=1 Tax=unclassified Parabacteroides TaxID=2649774 RepID=UPI002476D540|nr:MULTISPECIES: NVEALA domain-containing protein [unclassified Parabacteroides]MDH6344096.1 hypothetical protein [Parabacteroides sp. PM6-13]MDH6391543.1 hypothetical protein [Parabacteroides sp. PFB2-12]
MKKKIIGFVMVASIAVAAGWNVYQSENKVALSELGLANVEALAGGEGGESYRWDCWSQLKEGYGVYRCGVPCVWEENRAGDTGKSKCYS